MAALDATRSSCAATTTVAAKKASDTIPLSSEYAAHAREDRSCSAAAMSAVPSARNAGSETSWWIVS